MCGIAGIFATNGDAAEPASAHAVRRMARLMARRGPDSDGYWSDAAGRVQLGFRRLAVIEPTVAGSQPMHSGDGRSTIVFNGELYNFRELRHELEQLGVSFRTRTDTEVVLESLAQWGAAALERFDGMFALAWYDARRRTLTLARDHAGIKPLYYLLDRSHGRLAFASQLDALLCAPWADVERVRADVLHLFLRLQYVPAPYTLVHDAHQLEAGHLLTIDDSGRVDVRRWWSLPEPPERLLRGDEAVDALAEALERSVPRQMIAEVPLGVFLSGGVDSPLVTALARRAAGPSLSAFTIGNPGWRQDESEAASSYARLLDVDHHLRPVGGTAAMARVAEAIASQHEPFADFSILPMLEVSALARDEVTVALSGDGGDELFFGYERPLSLLRDGADFRWPRRVRAALYGAGKYGVGRARSSVIVSRSAGDYYFGVQSRIHAADIRRLAPGIDDVPTDFRLYECRAHDPMELAAFSRRVEFAGQLQRCLKKVDLASMHHSLEVRVPLLGREVIDVAMAIDPFESMRGGGRKMVLRDLLARFVPAAAIPTPKLGFSVPLGEWLRGPLRSTVEETLLDEALGPSGLLHRAAVERYWNEHLRGERDHKWGVWSLLALQWWWRKVSAPPAPAAARAALGAQEAPARAWR